MDRIFDAYNGIGGFSLEFMRKTRERMKWICEQVSGASVLDVGCSQGVCPILLGQAGFTVLGVDVNGEAVAFANEKLSGEDESVKKAVQFAQGNFSTYAFGDRHFDNVIFGEFDYAAVVRNDLFYLPEKKLAGSLERKQFSRAREAGLGGWLIVEDKDGGISVYDKDFNAAPTELTSMYDAELIVKSENDLSPAALYSAVTGEKLADVEYRNLSNITKGYVSFYDGDARLYGILDASGQVVSEPAFNMIGNVVGGHYVKVTVNEAEGLYDLDARAMAVPAAYQRIYTWGDKAPINDGYVCVEQDGKLGFIDLEGNVTCPIQYAKDSVNYFGCTLGATDMTGACTLIAADGTVATLPNVAEIGLKNGLTSSDGYFVTVKDADGKQGVVDWHGNQVVDFTMDYSAAIYANDCLYTGTSIYKLGR